ncbi:MAG: ATP-binding protein [Deltaproteobacteria bacterium]|nr:MAG: ATP-binding protein [Deltaproteobacteria bacterium]
MVEESSIFGKGFTVRGGDFANAGEVSCKVRNILKEIGINSDIIRRVAIVAYEAEMNVVMYAREGTLSFEVTPDRIKLVMEDEGNGIENIELAMQEGYSTATDEIREMGFGAGMGLPNIKKNSDDFKINSIVGKGTRVEVTIST